MRLLLATDAGTPGWPNEDFAAAGPGAAVLLDGATTVPRDADIGCSHGVAWYARTLGTELLAAMTAEPRVSLAAALASAIAQVRDQHQDTCDLTNSRTPAATVTAVRAEPGGVGYLALGDSSIAADYAAGRRPLILTPRNGPAKASPDVASLAITGTFPREGLRGVALLSDGATRITDLYDLLAWPAVIDIVRDHGPAELIRQVRAAEDGDDRGQRWPRYKIKDDATIVYWQAG
jgi:hypothetical protein